MQTKGAVSKRYEELDGLRGIAAFSVFLSHAIGTIPTVPTMASLNNGPAHILWHGSGAVVLFFVLSGFVLALPYFDDARQFRYWPYLVRRAFRLYPAYWTAIVASIVLNWVLFDRSRLAHLSSWIQTLWDVPIRPIDIVQHFLMIGPIDTHRIDPVIWSLVIEMKISVIFPLVFMPLAIWRSPLATAGVFCAAVVLSVLGPHFHVGFLAHLPEFLIGAALARYRDRIGAAVRTLSKGALCVVGAAAVWLYGVDFLGPDLQPPRIPGYQLDLVTLLTATGAATIVAIVHFRASFARLLRTKLASFLGEISYSFYLIHLPILVTTMAISSPVWPLEIALALSLSLVISFLVAYLMRTAVEKPFQAMARQCVQWIDSTLLLRPDAR